MKVHAMKLNKEPFDLIKAEIKTIEMRLYDEKRRKIKIDDLIEFSNNETNEIIKCVVIGLHVFSSFKELYAKFDKKSLGYLADEKYCYADMYEYYSEEEEQAYGVVGIEIQLLSLVLNLEYEKEEKRIDKSNESMLDKIPVKQIKNEFIK